MSRGQADFIAEATEILEALSRDLLALDEQRDHEADPALLNGIFRSAHSLKGLAGMFGEERVAALAHSTEELLDLVRMGRAALTDQAVEALLRSVELLQTLLQESAAGTPRSETTERAAALGEHLVSYATPVAQADDPLEQLRLDPAVRKVLTSYEEHRLRENLRKGVMLCRVRAVFPLESFDRGLVELTERLKPYGEVISTLPSSQPAHGQQIAFELLFGSRSEMVALERDLRGLPIELASMVPAAIRQRRGDKGNRRKGEVPEHMVPVPTRSSPRVEEDLSLRSLTQTVRVDIRRLDGLMNIVGELLVIRSNVQRLAEQARQGGAVGTRWGQQLFNESRALERKLEALQKGVLEVRMVPLGQVFDKLSRLVRRVVREAGKEVEFEISGGEVELDKLIVEELADPLMHLIRNAIDHGIEPPPVRERAGKARRGRLELRAVQRGSQVEVALGDDGAGLDEARIRQVAVERGLVSADAVKELSLREVHNLLFLPGFSTVSEVSALSGRGVGLDVVKTNLARLSGMIDVRSRPGRGTTFTLTLPVTLAIIRALVVSVSGRTYAVPLNSVLEIVSVEPREVRTIERKEVVSLRGQTLRFSRLARLFELPERPVSRHFMVVVGLAEERLGIAVDEMLGQQDIVIKPLGGRLSRLPGIAGATDLGNQQTVLVLDVGALIEEVLAPERRREHG